MVGSLSFARFTYYRSTPWGYAAGASYQAAHSPALARRPVYVDSGAHLKTPSVSGRTRRV